MKKEFWIKLKEGEIEGRYSHYGEKVLNNDIFRLPHKSRKEAEDWIKRIADGRNLFRCDFYIEEVA